MKKTKVAVLTIVPILMTCCKPMPDNVMVFKDSIKYIDSFPQAYTLENPEDVSLDIIGVLDFTILDSIAVFNTMEKRSAWKILSLEDMHILGEILDIGNGPEEFLSIPWPSQCEFFNGPDGDQMCYVMDMSKRRLGKVNITESIEESSLNLEIIAEDLPEPCFRISYIDSTGIFYKTISSDMTSQPRYLLRDGESIVPGKLDELNAAHVYPGKNYNLMSSFVNYVRSRDLIVEVPVALTDINLYSPDGQNSMSLCLRDRPSDIDALQQLSPADIPHTFSALRTYGDYFAVLYIGETAMTYETGRKNLPHVYVFDYEGNPKADIALDKQVTSFDFDMEHGFLYAFDLITEQMYRYELPGNFILESM